MKEMTKEEKERSAELSRKGYFVKEKSEPTNTIVIKQKVTINKDYKNKLAEQQEL